MHAHVAACSGWSSVHASRRSSTKQTGCVKDARGALEQCRRRSEEESSTAARLPTSKAVDTAGGGASDRGCSWVLVATDDARGPGTWKVKKTPIGMENEESEDEMNAARR